MLRDRLWWWGAAGVVGAVALTGCKNSGRGVDPPVADAGSEPDGGDDVWTPEMVSAAIGEAAAEAAVAATGDRAAVVDASVAGAVDQAMLVAPDLGIDVAWAGAVREEVGKGVVADASGASALVDRGVIEEAVRVRTLEWMRRR